MTSDITTTMPPSRRMAREPQLGAAAAIVTAAASAAASTRAPTKVPSKLDRVEALLREVGGATIAQLMAATGWQQHSVRGALAGALRKRGLTITSDKVDGARCYRASRSA